MEIYVAILHDRHCDDAIELSTSLDDAMDQVEGWKSQYRKDIWITESVGGWVYFSRSACDDGPNIRIEKHTLDIPDMKGSGE